MMVFWKAGLVFLSVPKTGTQAYEAALRPVCDILISDPPVMKHINARDFDTNLRPFLQEYRKPRLRTLAVIREPISWLGSWYRYRSRPALQGTPRSTAEVSFEQFVEGYLNETPPPYAKLGAQSRFVTNLRGKMLVDHLFAYEQQDKLRAFLSSKLGRDVPPPPPVNVSPKRALTLSAPLEAELRQHRAADFTLHAATLASQRPEQLENTR